MPVHAGSKRRLPVPPVAWSDNDSLLDAPRLSLHSASFPDADADSVSFLDDESAADIPRFVYYHNLYESDESNPPSRSSSSAPRSPGPSILARSAAAEDGSASCASPVDDDEDALSDGAESCLDLVAGFAGSAPRTPASQAADADASASSEIVDPTVCGACKKSERHGDGSLIVCEARGCARGYHVSCLPRPEQEFAWTAIRAPKRWCCHMCRPRAPAGGVRVGGLLFSPGAAARGAAAGDDDADDPSDARVIDRFPLGAAVANDLLATVSEVCKRLIVSGGHYDVCSICGKRRRRSKRNRVAVGCSWCVASTCAECIGVEDTSETRSASTSLPLGSTAAAWLCPVDAYTFWRHLEGRAAECRIAAPHFDLKRVTESSGRRAEDRKRLRETASSAAPAALTYFHDVGACVNTVCTVAVAAASEYAIGSNAAVIRRADAFANCETCLGDGAFREAATRFRDSMSDAAFSSCANCRGNWFGPDWLVNDESGLCTTCTNSSRGEGGPDKAARKYGMESRCVPLPLDPRSPFARYDLTWMETQLIASININISVFHLPLTKGAKGCPLGQYARRGQMCAYTTDKAQFYHTLPRLPEEVEVIIIRSVIDGSDTPPPAHLDPNVSGDRTYYARRHVVQECLEYLRDARSPAVEGRDLDFDRVFGADWTDGSQAHRLKFVDRSVVDLSARPPPRAATGRAEDGGGDAGGGGAASSHDFEPAEHALHGAGAGGGEMGGFDAAADMLDGAHDGADDGNGGAAEVDDGRAGAQADIALRYDIGAAEDNGQGGRDDHAERVQNAVKNAIEMDFKSRGFPVSHKSPWFYTRCFPHLFPDGSGDITDPRRDADRGMTFRQWALSLVRSKETRFRRDPMFIAVLNNILTRDKALAVADQVLYVLRQKPSDAAAAADDDDDAPAKLSVERLRQLVDNPDSGVKGLLASQLATSPGTPQYWSRQRARLEALITQIGRAPSAFVTFSAADTYWKDLGRLLGLADDAPMAERQRAVARDPAVCVEYFRVRLRALFTELYGDRLSDYYIRFEFQERGSVHAHCLIWLRGVPDIPALVKRSMPGPNCAPDTATSDNFPTFTSEGVRSMPLRRDLGALDPDAKPLPLAARLDGEPHVPAPPPVIADRDTPDDFKEVLSIADYYTHTWHLISSLSPEQRIIFQTALDTASARPSASEFADDVDVDEDTARAKMAALLELVQRHTECGPGCLRKGKCRYLHRPTTDYSIHADSVLFPHAHKKDASSLPVAYCVGTARNDDRLGRVHLQCSAMWRANTDFQLILDLVALALYVTKYATKCEKASESFNHVLRYALDDADDDASAGAILRKLAVRTISTGAATRKISNQEAVFNILGLPLIECSRAFVHLNTAPTTFLVRRRLGDLEAGDSVIAKSIHEIYAERPPALRRYPMRALHADYNYDARRGEWRPRTAPAIITVSPRFSNKPLSGGPEYESFCLQYMQLNTAYGPHCDFNKLADVLHEGESWSDAFRRLHPDEYQRLELAEATSSRARDDADEVDMDGAYGYGDGDHDDGDGGMKEGPWWQDVGVGKEDAGARMIAVGPDVAGPTAAAIAAQVLKHYTTVRRDFVRPPIGGAARPLDELNSEQYVGARIMIDALLSEPPSAGAAGPGAGAGTGGATGGAAARPPQAAALAGAGAGAAGGGGAERRSAPRPRLRLLIRGKGGTGKSEIVKAVDAYVQQLPADRRPQRHRILILAPTGKAASNIGGVTLHSALSLSDDPLSADRAAVVRDEYSDVGLVLIDEIGMLGTKLMAQVALRLREIFGACESSPLLGNVHVVGLGDFGQLVPVKDDPVWAGSTWKSANARAQAGMKSKKSDSGAAAVVVTKAHGAAAWRELYTGANLHLTHIWRQAPAEVQLRGILSRLRDGDSTYDDVEALNSRHISRVGHNLTPEQLRAFTLAQTKAEIADINKAAMTLLDVPIRVSRAVHTGDAKGLAADDFRGIARTVFLQKGSRYLLTCNLWVDAGLYNGTECYLEYVVYATDEDAADSHPPGYALMTSAAYLGPPYDPDIPHSFAVPILTRPSDTNKSITRMQLPLLSAAGITVHKAQGMTVPFFFLRIGDTERALGSRYVALSRGTGMQSFVVTDEEGVTLKRLIGLSRSERADQRRAFDLMLDESCIATMHEAVGKYADGFPDGAAALTAAVDRARQAHADGRARNEARIAERVAELRGAKRKAIEEAASRDARAAPGGPPAGAASSGTSGPAAPGPRRKRARHAA